MSRLPSNNTYRTQTNPQITVTPLYDAFGKPIIQPTQPIQHTYMQENPIIQPTHPTYMQKNPIIQPTQPTYMQTTQTSTHHPSSKAPTGSESIHYRETPHSFVVQQKSSYHDPVSGISQKIKSVSQGRQHDTTRNRSSSSEKKRKQNENNISSFTSNQPISNPTMTYQQPPILSSTNTYTQPPISTMGYNQPPISEMGYTQPPISNPQMGYTQPPISNPQMGYTQPSISNPQMGYTQPPISNPQMGYTQPPISSPQMTDNINQNFAHTQPINENQRSDISYQRMPAYSTNTQNEKKDYSIKIPFLMHDPNKLLAVEKGTIKNTSSGVKTSQKLTYIDPKTGYEENVSIKTKVRGDKNNSGSQGKSKTTYMHKVQETPEGPKVQIKQKHREGGIMDNIKNKIHNMINK